MKNDVIKVALNFKLVALSVLFGSSYGSDVVRNKRIIKAGENVVEKRGCKNSGDVCEIRSNGVPMNDYIKNNPELCYEMLEEHKNNVNKEANSCKVRIFGSKENNFFVGVDKYGIARVLSENDVKNRGRNRGKNKNKKVEDDVRKCVEREDVETFGFIVSEDGYIVADYSHLVGCDKVKVVVGDNEKKKEYDAKIVGGDDFSGVIVLKVEGSNLPHLKFGNYSEEKAFKYVYKIGNDSMCVKTTTVEMEQKCVDCDEKGCVKKKMRKGGDKNNKEEEKSVFRTYNSSKVSLPSSFAMVDINGCFVGLRSSGAKFRNNIVGGSRAMVPCYELKKIFEELKKNNGVYVHSYRGFSLSSFRGNGVIKNMRKPNKLDEVDYGCCVEGVSEELQNCGLKKGDIILKLNGYELRNVEQFYKVFDAVRNYDLSIEVLRSNEKRETVKVRSGICSDVKYKKADNTIEVKGAVIRNLDASQLGKLMRKKQYKGGVVIDKIDDEKRWSGCKKGFVITSINKVDVGNVDDVKNILATMCEKDGETSFFVEGLYLNNMDKRKCFGVFLP